MGYANKTWRRNRLLEEIILIGNPPLEIIGPGNPLPVREVKWKPFLGFQAPFKRLPIFGPSSS